MINKTPSDNKLVLQNVKLEIAMKINEQKEISFPMCSVKEVSPVNLLNASAHLFL